MILVQFLGELATEAQDHTEDAVCDVVCWVAWRDRVRAGHEHAQRRWQLVGQRCDCDNDPAE